MDTRPELDGNDEAPRASVGAKVQGRRRLLSKSLGAAPVLFTIGSGPAIAGKMVKTASAKCSASTSAPTRGTYDCNGKSHHAWATSACNSATNTGWSSAHKSFGHGWPCSPTTPHKGTYNRQVWSSCAETWSPTGHKYEVLNRYCARAGTPVDEYWKKRELTQNPSASPARLKLAAHCAAALLNCEAQLIPAQICDQNKVREIWEACKSGNGTWMPPGSICSQPWNIDQVCDWLHSMCTV